MQYKLRSLAALAALVTLSGCSFDPSGLTNADGGEGTSVDLCPADPDKLAPGICGCGNSDADSDGDGTPDCIDDCPGDSSKIGPGVCGCGVADEDLNGDGEVDCVDGCPDDPDKLAPGVCGCGNPDTDTDRDGTPDCVDDCPRDPSKVGPGICGCQVSDADTDGDGTANCRDDCPHDPDKTRVGACGCGVPDVDHDGDGEVDCVDECPDDPDKMTPGVCGCGFPGDSCDAPDDPERVVALGAVHGDIGALREALKVGEVMDDDRQWIGDDTVVVVTGDMIGFGPREREVLSFLRVLRYRARSEGGEIIILNGNQEIANMRGDYRDVDPDSCDDFADLGLDDLGVGDLFGLPETCKQRAAALLPGGPFAGLLSEYPVATIVGDSVFVHGGVLPEHIASTSLERINADFSAWARGEGGDVRLAEEIASNETYSVEEDLDKQECRLLDDVLGELKVSRMVMSHHLYKDIESACDETAWRITTGMSDYHGGKVQVLEIEKGRTKVLK